MSPMLEYSNVRSLSLYTREVVRGMRWWILLFITPSFYYVDSMPLIAKMIDEYVMEQIEKEMILL
jgi:hypothetical protein